MGSKANPRLSPANDPRSLILASKRSRKPRIPLQKGQPKTTEIPCVWGCGASHRLVHQWNYAVCIRGYFHESSDYFEYPKNPCLNQDTKQYLPNFPFFFSVVHPFNLMCSNFHQSFSLLSSFVQEFVIRSAAIPAYQFQISRQPFGLYLIHSKIFFSCLAVLNGLVIRFSSFRLSCIQPFERIP